MAPLIKHVPAVEGRPISTEEAEPRSLTERAYRSLRADIIEGRHAPGGKLRVEHLKDVYQVSSGTLREALALLVSDLLVVPQSQKGFRVAPMSLADIEDLTRTRTLLECAAMRESIAQGGPVWRISVADAYERLAQAETRLVRDVEGVFDEWENCNRVFHEALTSGCQSRWILRFRALLYQQARRYRHLSAVTTQVPANVHEEHRLIFEAAMAGDDRAADEALSNHIQLSLSVIKATGVLR